MRGKWDSTDKALADYIGIQTARLGEYKRDYPEIYNSLREGWEVKRTQTSKQRETVNIKKPNTDILILCLSNNWTLERYELLTLGKLKDITSQFVTDVIKRNYDKMTSYKHYLEKKC